MTDLAQPARTAAPPRLAPLLPMLLAQTRAEFVRLWRNPAFSVISLALPVIFFAIFGLPHAGTTINNVQTGKYLLASFGSYGVISVMLFSFGVSVAIERGQRMNVLMRATPLRPLVLLLAKVLTALGFGLLTLLVLFVFGGLTAQIHMSVATWVDLTLRLLLGAIPFVALGFAIGYIAGPTSAAPVTQLLFLVLAFSSGIFVPLTQLPNFIQKIAPYLPTFRYAQLGWNALGDHSYTVSGDVIWLIFYTAIFVVLAVRGYYRENASSFG